MRRTDDEGTWDFAVHPGMLVVGVRGTERIEANLDFRTGGDTLRLGVIRYLHDGGNAKRLSAPPIDDIEAFANQPANALALIERRDPMIMAPMTLPDAHRPGRKPDRFYGQVLILKRASERGGRPYAEHIAQWNNVEPNVVYRWVAEAKRREITIDDDEVGTVRIKGRPMTASGEPVTEGTR